MYWVDRSVKEIEKAAGIGWKRLKADWHGRARQHLLLRLRDAGLLPIGNGQVELGKRQWVIFGDGGGRSKGQGLWWKHPGGYGLMFRSPWENHG